MRNNENPEKRFKTSQGLGLTGLTGLNSMHSKKSSFGGMGSGNKFFPSDLDKELMAAEIFLSKNNDEVLKSVNKQNSLSTEADYLNSQINLQNSSINDLNPKSNKIPSKLDNKLDQALVKYQKQLKAFGFPEIGNFYFPLESNEDKEKTFHFFDFVINKKSQENEEKMKFKKQIDILSSKISSLQSDNERLEKELLSINEEIKKTSKDRKEFESKINKSKETLEKQINELKSANTKMSTKYHTLLAEKKAVEEKYNKIAENYQKLVGKQNFKPTNHIDMIDNMKRNDILKLLSKVKGTEKLIETFKNGFNESLRELLFEVSALKNFLYELNSEIVSVGDHKYMELDYNLLNMPFLDTVNKIKYVFKNNLKILNKNVSFKDKDNTFLLDENKIISGNSIMCNDLEMTFDKREVISGDGVNCVNNNNYSKNIIFDVDEPKEETQNSNLEEDNYENELEFLKNKWVKTLMNIKDKASNTSDDENENN